MKTVIERKTYRSRLYLSLVSVRRVTDHGLDESQQEHKVTSSPFLLLALWPLYSLVKYRVILPFIKYADCDADQSPPLSASVYNTYMLVYPNSPISFVA
jgi:hypothetical protein